MTKNDRAKIAEYADRVGGEKFRVTRSGDVHIKGPMPNSVEAGWYLAGSVDVILQDIAAGNR